jgi:2-dehydro-3-deoxyphosphogluconate aldolase / (4S)-4-hydroxy-2-oxoglutarate aldolase
MTAVLDELAGHGVVPVVTMPDADLAMKLADALVAGGLPVAEMTLRTPAGLAAIRAMSARGDLLVGAGTVTSIEQVDAAVEAGARFVVSPGLDAEVVTHCTARGIAVLPGVATATELQAAVRLGVNVVKLFPAELVGGLALVHALAAPFPQIRFVPTGGITPDSVVGYLSCPAVAAVGGSWLATRALLADEDWTTIADNCRRAAAAVAGVREAKVRTAAS